jgi:hypothetical protein
MASEKSDEFCNRVGGDRIASRQIDELIGLARGLVADNHINQAEVKFLQKCSRPIFTLAISRLEMSCIAA